MLAPEILLVEPDDTLAVALLEALAEDGYRAEHAPTHEEALALCAARGQAGYRLLIVPSMRGGAQSDPQLEHLRRKTGARVLLRAPWQRHEQTGDGATTLREPFTLDDLLNAVAALLCDEQPQGRDTRAMRDAADAVGGVEAPHYLGETRATGAFAVTSGNETSEMDPFKASYLRARASLDQLDAALMESGVAGDALAEQGIVLAALRDGAFLLCPPSCPREGCAVALFELHRRDYIRVCYGAEQGDLATIAAGARMGMSCPHCGVRPGQWHHVGCFFEMCPLCGESLLDGCYADHAAPRMEMALPGMDATPRMRQWSQPKPAHLARMLRGLSPHLQSVHDQTGVDVRPSVRVLMMATSTNQMYEALSHVGGAELDALRLLYQMIR